MSATDALDTITTVQNGGSTTPSSPGAVTSRRCASAAT